MDGYQIQEAGPRSTRSSGAGRLIGAMTGGESGGVGVYGAAVDGTSPRTAPAPAVRFRNSRRLVMESRSLWSMEEIGDNVKRLRGSFCKKGLDRQENLMYTPNVKHHSFSETAVRWTALPPL